MGFDYIVKVALLCLTGEPWLREDFAPHHLEDGDRWELWETSERDARLESESMPLTGSVVQEHGWTSLFLQL